MKSQLLRAYFSDFGHNDSLSFGPTAANKGTDLFCIEAVKQDDGSYDPPTIFV